MKTHRLALLIFSILLISSVSGILAEAMMTRKETSAELQLDEEFHPELGTYYYDVFWQGVRVGKATITTTRKDGLYHVIVNAKAASKVSLFYTFKYRGEAKMDSDPLRPHMAAVEEIAGRKQKKIQIDFPSEDRAEAVEIESVGGKTKTVTKKSVESDTFILDPFSVVFLIRHLDWNVGMAEIFDVFTGDKQYELTLLCDSLAVKTIAGNEREAWVITPLTRKISDQEEEVKSEFTIYISMDEKKEILKIEGAPRVGRVEARMRQFAPETTTD